MPVRSPATETATAASPGSPVTTTRYPAATRAATIRRHSAGLAAAARDNLDARVEHCPDWSVADLVWHVSGVHWFWGTIAGELLTGLEGIVDLTEPFARIREAITEARKMGVASRN